MSCMAFVNPIRLNESDLIGTVPLEPRHTYLLAIQSLKEDKILF